MSLVRKRIHSTVMLEAVIHLVIHEEVELPALRLPQPSDRFDVPMWSVGQGTASRHVPRRSSMGIPEVPIYVQMCPEFSDFELLNEKAFLRIVNITFDCL